MVLAASEALAPVFEPQTKDLQLTFGISGCIVAASWPVMMNLDPGFWEFAELIPVDSMYH